MWIGDIEVCGMSKPINVVLDPELEAKVRDRIQKKGDLSNIVNKALRRYFADGEVDKTFWMEFAEQVLQEAEALEEDLRLALDFIRKAEERIGALQVQLKQI